MVGNRRPRSCICGRGWSLRHTGARTDHVSYLSEVDARDISRSRRGHPGRRSDHVGELRDGLSLAYVAILVHSPVVVGCRRPPGKLMTRYKTRAATLSIRSEWSLLAEASPVRQIDTLHFV